MCHLIRILGIDPGLRRTGWGLIESEGNRLIHVACGSVETGERDELGVRLLAIHDGLVAVIERYRPQEAAAHPFYLHAFEPTYEGDRTAPALRYLNETVAQGGWAILVFHDVLPRWRADGDASMATHNRILAHIAGLDVWCAPMGQVFDYVQSHWGRAA